MNMRIDFFSVSVPKKAISQQNGFSLFEVLIASLILAVAVAAVMRLHTLNLRETAGNDELQRAYWLLSNAQQRYVLHQALTNADIAALNAQAQTAGLRSAQIINSNSTIGVSWHAWDDANVVHRGGCTTIEGGFSCIQVGVQ